jgi:hypothetical protein
MTEQAQEQAPPWYERAARRPRLRVLGSMAALLFYPFLYVFPVYRALDATYQNAREDCAGHGSYADCWKPAFNALRDEPVYHCQVDRENPVTSTFAREIVETVDLPCRVAVPLSRVHWGVSGWIRRREWPLFRQGYEFEDICSDKADAGDTISEKVRTHCKAQRLHFLRDEPVEPIAIYGEVRVLFQETARRFDKAIAEYEHIRFLFGALMWGWAALELAGITLLLGIARADLARWRLRASQRGRDE